MLQTKKQLNSNRARWYQVLPLLLMLVCSGVLLSLLFKSKPVDAAIPKTLNFQGKLTNASDGTNVANGNYSMQFKIYDASSSGNLLWTETWDGTGSSTQVNVTNGVFTVKLGSFTSLSNIDFTGGNLYLSINFNPGTGYDGEMSPRKQLLSAPFAFNANNLVGDGRIGITYTSTSSPASTITYNPNASTNNNALLVTAGSNVTGAAFQVAQAGTGYAALFTGGSVGIGTTTPGQTLTVAGNERLTGALFDSTNASGTLGMVLQTTGTSTRWVATSTLGISSSPCVTAGYSVQYNNNGSFGCSSKLITDGTLVGYNATSSTVSFNIQGTSGSTNDIFNIASSTGVSIFKASANNGAVFSMDASSSNSSNTTSSTVPVLQLGSNALNTPIAGGTYLAINAPGNFQGQLMNIQVGGTQVFGISNASNLAYALGLQVGGNGLWSSSLQSIYGQGVAFGQYGGWNTAGPIWKFAPNGGNINGNSSGQSSIGLQEIFNPTTAGSGQTYASLFLNDTINQTSGANGITRSEYIAPALTSVYDYRSLEVGATTTTLGTSTPTQILYNVLFNPLTYQTSSTSKYTIATSSTLTIAGAPIASTTSLALTNSIGLLIQGNNVTASTTNGIGLEVAAPTGATNSYAALFTGGNIGIGTTTPAVPLSVVGKIISNQVSSDLFTSFLLHFDGSNGSTVFTDSSPYGATVTPHSGAQISTTASEFGGASGKFNGSSDYLSIPYSTNVDLSGGDETIEAWFNTNSFASAQVIVSKDTSGTNFDWDIALINSTTIRFTTSGGASNLNATVPTMSTSTWYHVALVRHGTTNTIYLNGVSYGTAVFPIDNSDQTAFTVGAAGWNSPNTFFNGYIDELRISKGVARYLSNFTPPTQPFTVNVYGGIGVMVNNVVNALDVNGGTALGTYAGSSTAPTNGLIVSGNVGIGSSTANSSLFVQGNGNTNPFNVASSSGTSQLIVTSAGNVGIGTSTPGQLLTVAGNEQLTGALFDSTNASGTLGMILQATGTSTRWVATSTLGISGGAATPCVGTNYSLQYNNNASFGCVGTLITNGSLVGYNATSSTVSFNIQGTLGSNNTIFNVASSSGASILAVAPNGNVGIGSTSPMAALSLGSGQIAAAAGSVSAPSYAFGNSINTGFYLASVQSGNGYVRFASGGADAFEFGPNYLKMGPSTFMQWDSSGLGGVTDTSISRNAAGVVAIGKTSTVGDFTGTLLAGNIGIGTSTTNALLTLQGTGTNTNLINLASTSGASLLNVSWYGGLTQNISSTTAVNIQDGSGNSVFAVDTTQNTSNAGLDITAGGSQTGNLLNVYSSGSTLLSGITAYGGWFENIASTSALTIQNGSGSQIFGVNTLNGVISIATSSSTTINSILTADGQLTIGDDGLTGTTDGRLWLRSHGTIFRFNSTGNTADYSEFFYQMATTTQDVGTVMSVDNSTSTPVPDAGLAIVASSSYDSNILGVVSDKGTGYNNPNDDRQFDPHYVNIGMLGHIKVKVTDENGAIAPGDYLTSSAKFPGYAMKATRSGNIIGQALIAFPEAADLAVLPPALGGTATSTLIASSTLATASSSTDSTIDGVSTSTPATSTPPSFNQPQTPAGPVVHLGHDLTLVDPGYKIINYTFVLGPNDGQLVGRVGGGVAPSGTATGTNLAFLIDQQGSGNILQLQSGEQDRFLVASSGAVSILANASSTQNLLTVSNASTSLFTIDSVGDLTTTGHITVGQDTAGTATIKAGDNQTTVTFATPYTNVPKVAVTVQGLPNFYYGVVNKTATGFTIQTSQPVSADTSFDWIALAQPQDTASQSNLVVVNNNNNPSTSSEPSGNNGGSVPSAPPADTDDSSSTLDSNASSTPSSDIGQVAGTSTPSSDQPTPTPVVTPTPTVTPIPQPTVTPDQTPPPADTSSSTNQ